MPAPISLSELSDVAGWSHCNCLSRMELSPQHCCIQYFMGYCIAHTPTPANNIHSLRVLWEGSVQTMALFVPGKLSLRDGHHRTTTKLLCKDPFLLPVLPASQPIPKILKIRLQLSGLCEYFSWFEFLHISHKSKMRFVFILQS